MKKDDIVKAFEMRLDGKTLEEIGQHFGVSRERIRQLFVKNAKSNTPRKIAKIVYPGLREWFQVNCMSPKQMFDSTEIFPSVTTMYRALHGEREIKLTEVKAIHDFTGLTFEEAFGDD